MSYKVVVQIEREMKRNWTKQTRNLSNSKLNAKTIF